MLSKKAYTCIFFCLIVMLQMECAENAKIIRQSNKGLYEMVFKKFILFLENKSDMNVDIKDNEIRFLLFLSSIIRQSELVVLEANTRNWFLRSGKK
jgi:hypothetical protein